VELKSLQNHGTNAPTLGGGGHYEGATELDNPTELPLYPCGSHHVSLFCLSHSSLASATPAAAGSRAAGDGGHGERSFVEPLSSPGGFRHHPPHPHPHQSAPPPQRLQSYCCAQLWLSCSELPHLLHNHQNKREL
jgi:hypothetical protein